MPEWVRYPCLTCGYAEWRWLDCEECKSEELACRLRECVECGATFADEREGE